MNEPTPLVDREPLRGIFHIALIGLVVIAIFGFALAISSQIEEKEPQLPAATVESIQTACKESGGLFTQNDRHMSCIKSTEYQVDAWLPTVKGQ